MKLRRFDAIVLSLGANDVLALKPVSGWERTLSALLDLIEADTAGETKTFILSVPLFQQNPHFPRVLGRMVDRHVHRLNSATQAVIAGRPNVVFVPLTEGARQAEGSHAYQRWAKELAPRISLELDAPIPRGGSRDHVPEEAARQDAAHLRILAHPTGDAALNRLTESVRTMFGTAAAAITLIGSVTQVTVAATCIAHATIPRSDAFCDLTIRHDERFVVQDTRADPLFADNPSVTGPPGIRFYAGYPIESPDGFRVGALWIMDTKPRLFTSEDAAILRILAQQAQEQLWTG
ncbi:GAF domain-containing protein [Glaciihabitans sp. UYNi722]|uniref:GAF domain-containing protein n=1 Tax=Glaciihabitans sp. UYNi722 TaxID=3156344 RepID=UPI0033959191